MLLGPKEIVKRFLPRLYRRQRARWFRLVRPAVVDYCPVLLPWFHVATSTAPVAQLHRLAYDFRVDDRLPLLTALCLWLSSFVWPIRLVVTALSQVRRYGRFVKQTRQISRWKQLTQLLRFATRYNIPPASYYKFRLFDEQNARRAEAYLHDAEMNLLYARLAEGLPSDRSLRDKRRFFEEGREHGWPVAPVVAAFRGGQLEQWYQDAAGSLPAVDLVLKPVNLACGRGFERWGYDARDGRWHRNGESLDGEAFLQHCCAAAREPCILQERLINHPEVAPLAANGLCTVRVVTYRVPAGQPDVLLASLRMPTGSACVDNFAAGGLAAPVDLATGVLGRAVGKDPTRGTHDCHPDTGAPIAGTRLPHWPESLDLCRRAHDCFAWMPFVGWDLVLTTNGPVLLEANPDWCVELAQISQNRPLGETVYPRVYLEHLRDRKRKHDSQVRAATSFDHLATGSLSHADS